MSRNKMELSKLKTWPQLTLLPFTSRAYEWENESWVLASDHGLLNITMDPLGLEPISTREFEIRWFHNCGNLRSQNHCTASQNKSKRKSTMNGILHHARCYWPGMLQPFTAVLQKVYFDAIKIVSGMKTAAATLLVLPLTSPQISMRKKVGLRYYGTIHQIPRYIRPGWQTIIGTTICYLWICVINHECMRNN